MNANSGSAIKLIECPRDAMQGLHTFIPTKVKIAYLNLLLKVGFDTLDFGSFVSPKAVPQMQDTAEVLAGLDLSGSSTKLLAIIANVRGAEQATAYEEITYLGFPLSVSETFQLRNTNKTIAQAVEDVAQMAELCNKRNKQLVVYLSMGFGNPYGDPYSPVVVMEMTQRLVALGIKIIAPSDTVGSSTPESIENLFGELIPAFPEVEFGAHLHSIPQEAEAKVAAAFYAGCRRFDGAIRGFGGCPMAKDDLTGNIATETILSFLEKNAITLPVNKSRFDIAWQHADVVFKQ
jgi:hydroxymethylglutaryl-CoA lyase